MEKESLYELLGIMPTASQSEIRTAFRKLAQKYHPDTGSVNPEHVELFKLITDAYHVLSDIDRRNEYNKSNGFQFHEELDLGPTVEERPEEHSGQKSRVEISGSGKDFSHLKSDSSVGDLKIVHKVSITT